MKMAELLPLKGNPITLIIRSLQCEKQKVSNWSTLSASLLYYINTTNGIINNTDKQSDKYKSACKTMPGFHITDCFKQCSGSEEVTGTIHG